MLWEGYKYTDPDMQVVYDAFLDGAGGVVPERPNFAEVLSVGLPDGWRDFLWKSYPPGSLVGGVREVLYLMNQMGILPAHPPESP